MTDPHPYFDVSSPTGDDESRKAVRLLNKGRGPCTEDAVTVRYYFEVDSDESPMAGILNAARMILEHGTAKPWKAEGPSGVRKPADYDRNLAWAVDVRLLGHNKAERIESGIVEIAYPLHFFDKRPDGKPSLAQLFMAIAGEPFSAFSFYRAARIISLSFPQSFQRKFPKRLWPNSRVRAHLGLSDDEPIIGTIVKPKTGLTPELFSRSVVEAALAGASFTKSDENLHLTPLDLSRYVERVRRDLEREGFSLDRDIEVEEAPSAARRFLFAPHITTDPDLISSYARAAVEAGANSLMFSPYYGGGFLTMSEIAQRYDVPIYAHTAGMNVYAGSHTWGIDPCVMYQLAGMFGAAFMQITTVGGYLRPDDAEKREILKTLAAAGLSGDDGMTLAIAGGLHPRNVGLNLAALGDRGRMLLAGTSVYSHPGGPRAGVRAIVQAFQAYRSHGITDERALAGYAREMGEEGKPLAESLA